MFKRPLVLLVLSFCLGIFLADKIRTSFVLSYLLTATLLIFSIFFSKKNLWFIYLLIGLSLSLGVTYYQVRQILPKHHILNFIFYQDKSFYTVKGLLINEPTLKENSTSFEFQAREIQSGDFQSKTCGTLLVRMKEKRDIHYGDSLMLIGNLYRPFKGNVYLSRRGIYCIMSAKAIIQVSASNKGFFLKRLALWLKENTELVICRYVSGATFGIMDAMILGEKKNIPLLINNSMVKTGTVHILVVSGFNVGIVAFIINIFLKLLRMPRRIRFCLVILCLITYCFITGGSTPVLRATIMAIVFILAYFIRRQPDIYNSCAIAAIIILAINPNQLFDIGFQLSFMSVFAIVYLYPKLKLFLRLDSLKTKVFSFLIEGCLVSFSAWLGTMGLIAYYFRIFSPITVIANIFIVPLATLITLSGFTLVIIGLILPPLAPFFASSCELFIAFLININAFLLKAPGAYLTLS